MTGATSRHPLQSELHRPARINHQLGGVPPFTTGAISRHRLHHHKLWQKPLQRHPNNRLTRNNRPPLGMTGTSSRTPRLPSLLHQKLLLSRHDIQGSSPPLPSQYGTTKPWMNGVISPTDPIHHRSNQKATLHLNPQRPTKHQTATSPAQQHPPQPSAQPTSPHHPSSLNYSSTSYPNFKKKLFKQNPTNSAPPHPQPHTYPKSKK